MLSLYDESPWIHARLRNEDQIILRLLRSREIDLQMILKFDCNINPYDL